MSAHFSTLFVLNRAKNRIIAAPTEILQAATTGKKSP